MSLRPAPPPRPPLTTTSGCAARRADSAGPAPVPGTPPGLGTGPAAARSLAGRRESCSRAALTGDDDKAGTVFRSDRWIRHPHDLGTLPAPHPGERTRL